jgi:hypothetical protein
MGNVEIIAQLAERLIVDQEVVGSSPTGLPKGGPDPLTTSQLELAAGL